MKGKALEPEGWEGRAILGNVHSQGPEVFHRWVHYLGRLTNHTSVNIVVP